MSYRLSAFFHSFASAKWGCGMVVVLQIAMASAALGLEVSMVGESEQFEIRHEKEGLLIAWPIGESKTGRLHLSLDDPGHLIQEIGIEGADEKATAVLRDSAPFWDLFVGERDANEDGPYTFFDKVDQRGYEDFRLLLSLEKVGVEIKDQRATVKLAKLKGEEFTGELRFTFFTNSPLIHLEAIVSTPRPNRAILYRAGVQSPANEIVSLTYDEAGRSLRELSPTDLVAYRKQEPVKLKKSDGLGRYGFDATTSPVMGRAEQGILKAGYRAVAMETKAGSVSVFPPPHKFLPPLDFAENVGFNFAWKREGRVEAGVRQPPLGDGRFRPWVDCPANREQTLDLFLLVLEEAAPENLEAVAALTRRDRYPRLEGYRTFSSHYHMHHTRNLIMKQRELNTDAIPQSFASPLFVERFKEVGMDIVHLAEFHGGPNTGLSRYEELSVLHQECARLSDDNILILPGEEPNVHLGGHWISFFPKPIYWDWPDKRSLQRRKAQMVDGELPAFERSDPNLGTIYFVKDAAEMLRLMEKVNGLMWTAHPRIKSSTGYPDRYRDEPFYQSSSFLGAAWKAMPANYANDRLGRRVLDLLDDMNQWGEPKQILAEADLFSLNEASELYGHANINYLKLDETPHYEDGWGSVLDALREKAYFSGTGEILIRSLRYNGEEFPTEITATDAAELEISADLQWTFPLSFAEIISGDGEAIYRNRIDLSDTGAFGDAGAVRETVDLSNRHWVRFEVWDVAENGAFTQTVRIR